MSAADLARLQFAGTRAGPRPRPGTDLTITSTAASPHALRVMTVVLVVLLPVVLAHQGRTYHVFRNRMHPAEPAGTARAGDS